MRWQRVSGMGGAGAEGELASRGQVLAVVAELQRSEQGILDRWCRRGLQRDGGFRIGGQHQLLESFPALNRVGGFDDDEGVGQPRGHRLVISARHAVVVTPRTSKGPSCPPLAPPGAPAPEADVPQLHELGGSSTRPGAPSGRRRVQSVIDTGCPARG